MKIAQIGPYPLNSSFIQGGVESSVYGLTKELAKINQLVVFDIPRIGLNGDNIEIEGNLTIFRFLSKGISNFTTIFQLRTILRLILKQKPDICHIHTTSYLSFFIYLGLKLYHFPIVISCHGLAHVEKRNQWKKHRSFRNLFKYIFQSLAEFSLLNNCPVFIVDTQYVAEMIDKYKKQLKIHRKPIIKVIPQGIHPAFFDLENMFLKNNLLSVGAFSKRKGHLFLIESMLKVRAYIPDLSLFIVGAIADRNYYQLMQDRIIEYGLESNIRIFPDASFEEVLEFYRSCEIFILHSEEESQGIVFGEAMAAGKSIVTTNAGGIPWVVENNINGFLSDYGDIDAFSKNIVTLLKNDALRESFEANNRRKSLQYDWKKISKNVSELYNTLI